MADDGSRKGKDRKPLSRSRFPEIEALDLPLDDRLYLDHLAREIAQGQVVLFAGAGLSKNARSCDGGPSRIPDWWQLAKGLKERLGSRMQNEQDSLKIADYFEAKYGRSHLLDAVLAALGDEDHLPGRVHELIVRLNFREIITTNFDTLIEHTFRQLHISPQVVLRDRDLVRRRRHPRILKMNGCVTVPSTIVLTGNDFLAYDQNHPLMEAFVLKSFVESTVLFVGFSLDDPAFRILNEKMVRALKTEGRQAYSLGFGFSEEQRKHWSARNVQLVDLEPAECGEETSQSVEYEELMFKTLWALVAARKSAVTPGRSGSGGGSSRHQGTAEKAVGDAAELAETCWTLIETLRARDLEERRRACDAFCQQFSGRDWSLDFPSIEDMNWRRRALLFANLFAPLPALFQLVDGWLGPGGWSRHSRASHLLRATPEEYRIPLLGFCGVLRKNPDLYFQAADSLWARQLDGEESFLAEPADKHLVGESRVDIARRFRYLMLASNGHLRDWAAFEFQQERLERNLSYLFLAEGHERIGSSQVGIEGIFDELLDGWVFGSKEPPETFEKIWDVARRDVTEGRSAEVPWELLVILSLAIDGSRIGNYSLLLTGAWHRGELHFEFLVEHVAWRLLARGRRRWELAGSDHDAPTSDPDPLEEYEQSLALFVKWLCKMAAGESETSAGRRHLVEKLRLPLYDWLGARRSKPRLRTSILQAYGALRELDPQAVARAPREWSDEEGPSGWGGLAEMRIYWPDGGGEQADPGLVGCHLLGLMGGDRPGERPKIIRWLIRGCGDGPLRKSTAERLARLLSTSWLRSKEAFGWLSLAAEVRERPEIREPLVRHLRKQDESCPETLFAFVKSRLIRSFEDLRRSCEGPPVSDATPSADATTTDADAKATPSLTAEETVGEATGSEQPVTPLEEGYTDKVAQHHEHLVPFAEDLDQELLDAVLPAVDPEVSFTRDGTAAFLAALIQRAPADLRARHGADWLETLERLIERGATAEGALGPVVTELSAAARDQLQSHLMAVALRRIPRRDKRPVEWIVATLLGAPSGSLPALEAGLVELVTSPVIEIAELSLTAILGPLGKKHPDLVDRHRERLLWIRSIVQDRGGFRPTSRFAALLEEIRDL